jgi:hypothetical protein
MNPLPPEMLPAVPHFFFTLFKVPFTVAYPNLIFWIVVIVAFVLAAVARLPRFMEGGE